MEIILNEAKPPKGYSTPWRLVVTEAELEPDSKEILIRIIGPQKTHAQIWVPKQSLVKFAREILAITE